jgi:cysteine-rich repeat protein
MGGGVFIRSAIATGHGDAIRVTILVRPMKLLIGVLLASLALASCFEREPDEVTPSDHCGDGVVQRDEFCDDGNNEPGDGCPSNCLADGDGTCGDTILQEVIGEVCDDGNYDAGDGCSADCLSDESCGNGIIDAAVGELCDDGNNDPGDGCAGDCLGT